jgi:hypothetical protein
MKKDTPGQADGNPISTIDLTTVSQLQNIPAGSTVTFRLYAWRDASIATGVDSDTVALGTTNGPAIGGTVSLVPEPAMLGLTGLGALAMLRRRR